MKSSFIAGVGYEATGTMAVAMTGGRLYGYQVPPEVHRAVAESISPGGAYNALVKGTGRAGISRCPMCGRFYPQHARHLCPVRHSERPATMHNDRARYAAGVSDIPVGQGRTAVLASEIPAAHQIPPQGPPPPGVPTATAPPRKPARPRPAVSAVVDPYPSSSTVNPSGRHQPAPAGTRAPNAAALSALPRAQAGQRVLASPDAPPGIRRPAPVAR